MHIIFGHRKSLLIHVLKLCRGNCDLVQKSLDQLVPNENQKKLETLRGVDS